ncbi:MAG TPA: ATP-grasp domain-containing protein [Thermodesulfobacteriota bacterium]|nr:ATP-grasp domain-containing protein [Thermodesulfobacteriota bacterium]
MLLYEHEAKRLFKDQGVSVPPGEVAKTSLEAAEIARKMGKRVIIKAQVLALPGIGAGDAQIAGSPEEAGRVAEGLLGKSYNGQRVSELLVEEALPSQKEIHVAIRVDGAAGAPLVMASLERLSDLDEEAKSSAKVASSHADPFLGLKSHLARKLAKALGFTGDAAVKLADQVQRIYRVYAKWNALTAGFNPLVITPEENFFASGAFLEIDDSALFRFPQFRELSLSRILDPLAREGKTIGVTYVGLEGDIGVICTGAGIGMATVDLISKGSCPANFLETGGGITEKQMADVMRLVLKKPGLKGVFLNMYGGINPIHEGAKGVVKVIREDKVNIPVVAKAIGNFQEETWKVLEEGGVTVIKTIPTDQAVEELFKRLGK